MISKFAYCQLIVILLLNGSGGDATKKMFASVQDKFQSTMFPFSQDEKWVLAERQILRLPAKSFPELPQTIIEYLDRRGYTIPQSYAYTKKHNVLKGRFFRKKQIDFAILASQNGASSILIFWSGSTRRITRIAKQSDKIYLQGLGNEEIGYSRVISVVGKPHILKHYVAYGGTKLPAITHDAIDNGYMEKASEIYYFDGKKWHILQGAD